MRAGFPVALGEVGGDGDPFITSNYKDAAQMTSIVRRNGRYDYSTLIATTDYHTYDGMGRLTDLRQMGPTNNTITNYTYKFDDASRITETSSSADGASALTLDANDQVTGATLTLESYSYDENGNRTNTGYATGAANRLLSDGTYNYEYDKEGNRTKRTTIDGGDVTEYAWDQRNRLIRGRAKGSEVELTLSGPWATITTCHDESVQVLAE